MARGQPKDCPYCGNPETQLLGRKKVLLQLRKCPSCLLMFRYPRDEEGVGLEFYQRDYVEGLTTEAPPLDELDQLKKNNFSGSDRDISKNVSIVKRYGTRGALLDYGCSWGYGLFQFVNAGLDVIGFEVSKSRSQYGRDNLGMNIINDFAELDKLPSASFDAIHTNHVLEHIPSPRVAFEYFQRLLKYDGTLFIFVPNAGGAEARKYGANWGQMIGEKHVLALDGAFFAKNLPDYGFSVRLSSWPHETTPESVAGDTLPTLDGIELLVVAKKNAEVR